MNMKKTLAGILAGAVAVSAMATMAMAADDAFAIEFGTKTTDYQYFYDITATGAFVIPANGEVDLEIKLPSGNYGGWGGLAEWNPVTVQFEGYTNDQTKTVSEMITIKASEATYVDAAGAKIVVPVTNSIYEDGLSTANFDKFNDGKDYVIITKIAITNIGMKIDTDANGKAYAVTDDAVKVSLVSDTVLNYVAQGSSGADTTDGTLNVEKNAPAKVAESVTVAVTNEFKVNANDLKNSQKRIIREGAAADLYLTFDKTTTETIFKYTVNGTTKVELLPKDATNLTLKLTNADLYKAAASEDDDEAFLGDFKFEGVTLKDAKLVVMPVGAAADDDATGDDATGDDTTTTPDDDATTPDDEANPPMGVAPVALAVLPVALAAAVVAKKRS